MVRNIAATNGDGQWTFRWCFRSVDKTKFLDGGRCRRLKSDFKTATPVQRLTFLDQNGVWIVELLHLHITATLSPEHQCLSPTGCTPRTSKPSILGWFRKVQTECDPSHTSRHRPRDCIRADFWYWRRCHHYFHSANLICITTMCSRAIDFNI